MLTHVMAGESDWKVWFWCPLWALIEAIRNLDSVCGPIQALAMYAEHLSKGKGEYRVVVLHD